MPAEAATPGPSEGADTVQVRHRLQALEDDKAVRQQRRDMVRSLRAAGLPTPDRLTGDVLAALAKAGAFRLRAAIVGSVAFQCYPGLLGVKLPASLARTGDLDLAQFHAISLAVEDRLDEDLGSVLQQVDPRFQTIPDPFDPKRIIRYALKTETGQERYSVEVLSPLRGPDRGRLTRLRALRADARLLRFLDFLLYQEQNATVLHGNGIPVNVPAPERFALHKLLVAQMRHAIPRAQIKAKKDLDQARALLDVLLEDRPWDVADIWTELRDRGPSWRHKADRSLQLLPAEMRARLIAAVEGAHP